MCLFHDVLGLDQPTLKVLLGSDDFGLLMLNPAVQPLPLFIVNLLGNPTRFELILQYLKLLALFHLQRLLAVVQSRMDTLEVYEVQLLVGFVRNVRLP